MNTELQSAVNPFLKFLRDRFNAKIDFNNYFLAYSGGKDSHFLYWFIKEFLHDERIEIVGVNTGFEIPEIRERIMRNSDIVLHPSMKRNEIKEKYGIPCYSKQQDEYIHRYQTGSRTENTMKAIMGENVFFNLNQNARDNLLSGKLHKVSNKCCLYIKEKPMMDYSKKTGKKAIIGVRQSESKTRKAKYETCLQSNGNFAPIYDFSDVLIEDIYKAYDIEIPNCYIYVQRTGCAGCPYGRNCEKELALLPEQQRRKAIDYFKESYDIKGINYSNLQEVIKF
ncbi:MAG: phosphoadenosine phosphosulfate reductase family protein [Bacteroidaceae bacterium]|nr:phosphoadenosine phosphosulfate reductase family protein [Bacteroidaceae bacterium]